MKFTKTKLLFGFAILTVVLYIYTLMQNRLPKLLTSSPPNNSTQSDYRAPIIFVFDREINLKELEIKITPEEKFQSSLQTPSVLKIVFAEPPRVNTDYKIAVSLRGKLITELSFHTADVQRDLRFNLQVQKNMEIKYPLMAKTPLETGTFRVVYSDPLTLEITVKSPSIPTPEIIAEVKRWVTENGGDAEAHKYVIASPSSTP